MAGSFFALLEKIRNESYSEKDKGTKFERLVRDYFRTSKRFIGQLDQVWLWNDFPFRKDFGGKDLGIDLVAKAKDGGYWAIQCKCYGENTTINKPAVDSFISASPNLTTRALDGAFGFLFLCQEPSKNTLYLKAFLPIPHHSFEPISKLPHKPSQLRTLI